MYKSLKDIYESNSFGKYVPKPYEKFIVLNEGGAGGSMIHPFDVPGVNTGKDLINIFDEAVKSIQSERPAVKIDGTNISIKIARNADGSIAYGKNGEIEFGVERGSKTHELDIRGTTIKELGQRFVSKDPSKPHGMIEASAIVLDIFNTVLPSIEGDLKKLKFFEKEKQNFFNMEYVFGHTNVIGYDKNFLAIHGVNQIDLKTRSKKEISYNKQALEDVIRKVKPIAEKFGFEVYGTIPAVLGDEEKEIDFTPALNTELTVVYTPDHAVTKRISAWLQESHNPTGKTITLANGRKISAMGSENYKNVTGRVPLDSVIKDNNDVQVKEAISGAVFVHATLLMGQVLKSAFRSDVGEVATQEGIVIRNLMYKGKPVGVPVKFTGEFIIGKETGKFAKSQDNEETGGILPNSINYMNQDKSYADRYVTRGIGGNNVGEGGDYLSADRTGA